MEFIAGEPLRPRRSSNADNTGRVVVVNRGNSGWQLTLATPS
jgi:hypothetical protein